MNYKLSQIAEICAGEHIGEDFTVDGVVTDSRTSRSGECVLFVAMQGVNHDSHQFIGEMMSRGVNSFLIEDRSFASGEGGYVVVENSIRALQLLAAHFRQGFSGEVVAITGSNGKTTIKEWIVQSVPSSVRLFRSPRSYNSQLGVALSLLMARGDEELILIEAGISRCGEMARLEEMVRPTTVIFTSIGDAHQEGFASLENKIEEKMILARRAKRLIYHSAYSELCEQLPSGVELCDSMESGGDPAQCNREIVQSFFRVMGYEVSNLSHVRPLAMRLELREGINDSIIINDSYSADINSLSIALDQLEWVAAGRKKTLILSDILQSGASSKELYAQVSKIIKRAGVDLLIGVGAEISQSHDLFDMDRLFFPSTAELLASLRREDYADRAILLKGNRECRFEKISHALSSKSHTTTLEVDLDAMVHNLNYFRSQLSPSTKLTAMVKASSYGAGDQEVARLLQHHGVDYLAVAFSDEGCRLREGGVTMPIIVLNADDGSFGQMIDYGLEPEIYSFSSLESFAMSVEQHLEHDYPVHIKLDTGMHRLGFMSHEVERLVGELKRWRGVVRAATIFSHLSTSDMPEMADYTKAQVELFEKMTSQIEEALGYSVTCHIANSAAIIDHPAARRDMVRLGIGLYGYGVGEEHLLPISTLKSRIVQCRELEAGEC
ncbi:MAG: alanine racemase, partial [Rikenellaceae bacterium]